jgi:2-iminoacetate synthase
MSQHAPTPSTALPGWASEPSPWGDPWAEVIERSEWFERHPDAPPTDSASPLAFRAVRGSVDDVPRVLTGPRGLFDSALARHMLAGPGRFAVAQAALGEHHARAALATATRGEPLDPTDVAALLSPAADVLRAELLQAATAITRARFGGRIGLYAPLYLSNLCTNRCVYCGFSLDNPIERVVLPEPDIAAEVEALSQLGFEHILLVTGESPREVGAGYIARAAKVARGAVPKVSIEVQPLSEADYGLVTDAGATGLALYQETYDPELYLALHPAGRKRNPLWRLAGPERAARAGIAQVGLGALLGCGDWRFEATALALHAQALQERFPRLGLSFSFPRLRHAEGDFAPPAPVPDEALVHILTALRLAIPEADVVLSTRESPALRDHLAPTVVTRMSAGSSTRPGGYAHPEDGGGHQFDIEDVRSAAEVAARLTDLGLTVCDYAPRTG